MGGGGNTSGEYSGILPFLVFPELSPLVKLDSWIFKGASPYRGLGRKTDFVGTFALVRAESF